jgi:hypothetical protein
MKATKKQSKTILDSDKMLHFTDGETEVVIEWNFSKRMAAAFVSLFGINRNMFVAQ